MGRRMKYFQAKANKIDENKRGRREGKRIEGESNGARWADEAGG